MPINYWLVKSCLAAGSRSVAFSVHGVEEHAVEESRVEEPGFESLVLRAWF